MKEAGVAIGDDQMTFALFYRQRGQERAICSGGKNDALAVQNGTACEMEIAVCGGDGGGALQQRCAMRHGLLEEKMGWGGRVDDCVVGNKKPARQASPEVWFFGGDLRFVE